MCLCPLFFRQPRSKLDSRPLHEKETMPVHKISDFRAGERVPLQHVSDKRPTLWSRPHTQFNRETSEDLVPEQEDENEEDEQREEQQRLAAAAISHILMFVPGKPHEQWQPR